MPVWLDVVLRALAAAGISSAALGYLFRGREERQKRERELKALLRHMDEEIRRNEKQFEAFRNSPHWRTQAPDRVLRTKTWEDNKIRIAELLEDDKEYSDIFIYYESVMEIDEFRRDRSDPATTEQDRQESVGKNLDRLIQYGQDARNQIENHIKPLQGKQIDHT